MTAIEIDILREQLLALVDGLDARMPFDEAVADFPEEAMNAFPPNVPYTPWQLLEHLRITQWDILDYIQNRSYLEPSWPEEYWPARDARAMPDSSQQPSTASGPTARPSTISWPTPPRIFWQ